MNLENVRKAARALLGYRSPAYQWAARVLTRYQVLRREGWETMQQIERMLKSRDGSEKTLSLRCLQHPIVVRLGTDDVPTVINNAIREEYGQFPSGFVPHVVVDAGAYIGDTSAYFLSRFPTCRVIALEPNEDSFALAARNLRPYGDRASLLKAALWTDVTTVRLGGAQTGAAISAQGAEVPTETIDSLMAKVGVRQIDLLKLDIEGAEVQVIQAGAGGWLSKVGMICLETHGREIEQLLIPLLRSAEFACARFRNVWYCTNRRRPT